jgi:IS30 family transposase
LISQQPAAAQNWAVTSGWKGNLLSGSKNSYIATLVQRHTRYAALANVDNSDIQTIVSALIKQAKALANGPYKSLTRDRGKKLADRRRFTAATNIHVYFCDPQSPWQRSSNENTIDLLRRYFPKGTDLSVYSHAHLNKVVRQLNERPRETLEFETPAERFNAYISPRVKPASDDGHPIYSLTQSKTRKKLRKRTWTQKVRCSNRFSGASASSSIYSASVFGS